MRMILCNNYFMSYAFNQTHVPPLTSIQTQATLDILLFNSNQTLLFSIWETRQYLKLSDGFKHYADLTFSQTISLVTK